MNKISIKRLFTMVLLMLVSMGAWADVKVVFGENGSDSFEGTGGKIAVTQEVSGTDVTVTLTVTPDKDKGYTISKSDIEVYATIASGGTRTPEIASTLELKGDDPTDLSDERKYTVSITPNFGVWVKSANFQTKKRDGAKGPDANEKPVDLNYIGTYYIANVNKNSDFCNKTSVSDRYYLCPSTEYYATDQPFLTTYKTNHSGNDKWTIEYAQTIDGIDYYHISITHNSAIKYLTCNEAVIPSNDSRGRLHLQAELDSEKSLFYFTLGNYGDKKGVNIIPKSDTNNRSINPSKANTDNYAGVNNGAGNWGSIQMGGLIGLWAADNETGVWYLEDIVPTPVVSIDATGKATISSSDATATYYYTTDGTTPTTNSALYETAISITGVETIKAIAVVNGEVSNVATYTVGSGLSYLIQNQECTAYYMVPGYESGGNVPANTSSVAGEKMEWLLKNAGAVNGLQYYYFVNKSTGNYLFRTTGDNIYVQSSTDRLPTEDGYKFYLRPNADGSYVIYPKDEMTKGLYKNGGNVANNNVTLNSSVTNTNGQWKFISSNVTDKKPLFEAVPFTLSDASTVHFYFIAGVGTTESYIVSPASPSVNAATSKVGTANDKSWMFVKADEDNWQTYYHIVSAATGEYMYFTGNATSTADLVNAIEMRSLSDTNDIHYQFVLARATTANAYYIIPRTHRDIFNDNKYYSLWNNSSSIKATLSRASNGNDVKWTFEENTTLFCLDPAFDQDGLGNVSITCPTFGTEIYYTMNGDDPTIPAAGVAPSAPTYKYDGAFLPPLGATQIKAKAVIKNGHSITSGVTEYNLSSLAQPTIAFNNTTNTVTISSISGATIYYTSGTTEPIDDPTVNESVTHDESPISFTITEKTYVKALAVKGGFSPSAVQSAIIDKVAAPVTDMTSDGKVKLTSNTPGVIIYYEIGDENSVTTPTTSSTRYTSPLENVSGKFIKAIAVKEGWITSDVGGSNGIITLQCAMPVIRRGTRNTFTISSSFPSEGVSYYYAIDGGDLTTLYEGPVTISAYPFTVRAIAKAEGYANSSIAEVTITEDLVQDDEYYLIASAGDFEKFITKANTIEGAGNKYKVTDDFTYRSTFEIEQTFTGTFEGAAKEDGTFCVISGLKNPLFNTTDGAVIKNVMLKEVNIAQPGSVGALVGEAEGNTLIYNCGILPSDNNEESTNPSEIKSTDGYCGGIVGWLKDNSRVINCFSYANITGGTYVGGIVGYNNYASKSDDIRTMVMNCMFYGDITAAGDKAPIYNGSNIANYYTSNSDRGLNNYNYFRFDKPYVSSINHYNCALGAEDRYLDRFEFFRHTLNSNRELAAWYITGNADDGKGDGNIMAKWVVDKSIAPYPILKPQGTYPSVVNHDAANAADIGDEAENHNQGRKFGELTVNISLGGAPSGAAINTGKSSITLNITDKNTANYDFNYRKVQLPYYNEVGTGNYTHNKVVTGWKITVSGGTNSFTTGTDYPAYNFVDRKCTGKDNYATSGRVFSQGAYYEVPDGVTEIGIEAYWADCAYLADEGLDVTYNTGYNTESQSAIAHYTDGSTYSINGDNQAVYTSFDNALTALGDTWTGNVYDKAIVLVGNYHKNFGTSAPGGDVEKPLTVMSADLNFDNEPDYCLFYAHDQRRNVTPIRFDFITMPSIGLAMKASGSSKYVQAGIFRPKGWFEITNTALIRFSQFEYSYKGSKTIASPLILMGGIYEQFVSTNQDGDAGNTTYLHLGGNAWFKEFNNGCHTNQPKKTPKVPISVSGGDFDKFYLSGVYRPNVTPDAENAECYVDGGRFGEVAGAGMQLINGNVTWLINGADIENFYGGGINEAKSITGDISTTISNSWVGNFYGGPKFGNMAAGKEVTSIATDCHFDNFFGAGYGGNAYNRDGTKDQSLTTDNVPASTWNGYISSDYGRAYDSGKGGISTSFDYEYLIHSDFSKKVARFYVNYASLSLATTRTTTSTLTRCTINKNFYGGGSLGSVNGDVTSTLTDCTVEGSAFGAGFSATTPTIDVMPKSNFVVPPSYDYNAGVFNDEHVEFPASVTYTWSDDATKFNLSSSYFKDDGDTHLIYTSTPLSDLGRVIGKVTLNIAGSTTVAGDVYGGGESSNVTGNTTVNILP